MLPAFTISRYSKGADYSTPFVIDRRSGWHYFKGKFQLPTTVEAI
jgi:hypothetical protein